MSPSPEVVQLTPGRFDLAEGPVWDESRQRLFWVNITRGEVLEGELKPDSLSVHTFAQFDETVGAVALGGDGALLVAAQEGVVAVLPDGSRNLGPNLIHVGSGRRLNDGAVDPAGRFVVGTLRLDGPSGEETLMRLDNDGTVAVLDDDLTLSNGLGWTADGTRMFSVDTHRRQIYLRDYNTSTGETGPRRTFATVVDGYPDGLCVDSQDHVWVAVWGAGLVRRIAPDGNVTDEIRIPAPHTSSVALAGPDLRTLVITTARQDLDAKALEAAPQSGALFAARVDVPGRPPTRWKRHEWAS